MATESEKATPEVTKVETATGGSNPPVAAETKQAATPRAAKPAATAAAKPAAPKKEAPTAKDKEALAKASHGAVKAKVALTTRPPRSTSA